MYPNLNPERALIFRIEHIENLPWNLGKGALHCRNSTEQNPNFVNIGNPELIVRRSQHQVPILPGGTLSDYVPFYFTPFSVMMLNIFTGYGGIPKRSKNEIVVLVSSIYRVQELGLAFVFTDQHAYAAGTSFYSEVDRLGEIDWGILQKRDFKTDDAYPGKQLRYQAEALIHGSVPMSAILGVCCHSDAVKARVEEMTTHANCEFPIHSRPGMYF